MRSLLLLIPVFSLLLAPSMSFSQQDRGNAGGGVVMVEQEIRIKVAPELPTIVVTIPRQRPEIAPVVLTKNPEDLISVNAASIKPRLSDLVINRIEEPQKMLAKERSQ